MTHISFLFISVHVVSHVGWVLHMITTYRWLLQVVVSEHFLYTQIHLSCWSIESSRCLSNEKICNSAKVLLCIFSQQLVHGHLLLKSKKEVTASITTLHLPETLYIIIFRHLEGGNDVISLAGGTKLRHVLQKHDTVLVHSVDSNEGVVHVFFSVRCIQLCNAVEHSISEQLSKVSDDLLACLKRVHDSIPQEMQVLVRFVKFKSFSKLF